MTSAYSQARDVTRHIWHHPSNKGHRVSRLAYASAFQLWARSTGRSMKISVGSRSQMLAQLHFSGSSEVVYANPPATELLTWSQHLKPGDWFIDVGANVGVYTIFAIEQGAQVTAFEPNLDAARLFRQNMALNGYTPEFHEEAVTDHIGTMGMTFDLEAANHLIFSPDERSKDVREVPTVTLDSVIGDRTVAGVKIDTEGTERLVLEGASRALAEKRISLLQLEWNYTSVKVLGEDRTPVARMLRDAGYRLVRQNARGMLTRPVTDLAVTHEDVFAVRED